MFESFKYHGHSWDNKQSFEQHTMTSTNAANKDCLPCTKEHFLLSLPSIVTVQKYYSGHSPLLIFLFLHHANCLQ